MNYTVSYQTCRISVISYSEIRQRIINKLSVNNVIWFYINLCALLTMKWDLGVLIVEKFNWIWHFYKLNKTLTIEILNFKFFMMLRRKINWNNYMIITKKLKVSWIPNMEEYLRQNLPAVDNWTITRFSNILDNLNKTYPHKAHRGQMVQFVSRVQIGYGFQVLKESTDSWVN